MNKSFHTAEAGPLRPLKNIPEPYRRYFLFDLYFIVVLTAFSTVLFWFTPLDMMVVRWLHHPFPDAKPWPYRIFPLWQFFNDADAILTGILIIGPLILFAMRRYTGKLTLCRRHILFIFLSLAVGPGLVVNVICKDHWGRPRPEDLTEFGGRYEYVKPLVKTAGSSGKSFPSGHASAGFDYVVFYFIFRRRKSVARSALAGSLVLGGLMGAARLAVGAHFPSDIMWSFLICFLTAFLLYYFVLRIPAREESDVASVELDAFAPN